MKKKLLVFLLVPMILGSFNLMAQSWVTGGNALTTNGTLGSTTNFSVIFKTNNTERGRITNSGFWGFGTTAPTAKVHINSAANEVPFRVQVNGSNKLWVDNISGGTAIGSSATPPANGLFVLGNTGIGTASPENTLHVFKGSAGSVTGYINAPLIVENSTSTYIHLLAPDANETGILFGKPASSVSGGIVYNNTSALNGLQFRTNGNKTRMVLTGEGKLAVGMPDPGIYKLAIRHDGGGQGGISIENSNLRENWEIFNGGGLLFSWDNNLVANLNSFTGVLQSISDERLKTNIKPMATMLEKILQLKPSTYQFKNSPDKQEYNGFIAQDVMRIFPAMVAHNVNPARNLDVYTMDYSQFGVLAVKGIQELQPVIEEQEKINEEQKSTIALLEDRVTKLEAALAAITQNKNINVSNAITNASLEQNKPNPFNKNTTIRYSLPQGSKGQINIYDQTGKIVKSLNTNESGQCELSGYNLSAGTYTYTLTINGAVALSKQMLIIK